MAYRHTASACNLQWGNAVPTRGEQRFLKYFVGGTPFPHYIRIWGNADTVAFPKYACKEMRSLEMVNSSLINVKCLISFSYIVILAKLYTNDYHWFVDDSQHITLLILSNTDMLISGTRQFNCRKQFPFVLRGPSYSCEQESCAIAKMTARCALYK